MATAAAVAHYTALADEARRHELQTVIDDAKRGFDDQYQWSDDYSFWIAQNEKARTIRWATAELAKLQVTA